MYPIASTAARLAALETQMADLEDRVDLLPWQIAALPVVQVSATTDLPAKAAVAEMTLATNLAANTTLQTLLNVSGRGWLYWASLQSYSNSSIRLVIEIDGVSVFDQTVTNASTTYRHIIGCGAASENTGGKVWFDQVPYRSSLVIKASKSDAPDGVALQYRYSTAVTTA